MLSEFEEARYRRMLDDTTALDMLDWEDHRQVCPDCECTSFDLSTKTGITCKKCGAEVEPPIVD